MAEFNVHDTRNTEIGSETVYNSLDLSEFINTYDLPQCVCVTDGNFLSRYVQISSGDVLLLKSCDSGRVTLSYRDERSHTWTEVTVGLDYPQKFNVLPSKEADDNNRPVSVIMYPTISDLLLDCPTYFEATAECKDPCVPSMSVNMGDRFWFEGVVNYATDGTDRLKVRDEKGNILFLSLQCRGNFCPLKDENKYTVKELLALAPVQRRLKMVNTEQTSQDGTERAVRYDVSGDEYTAVIKPSNLLKISTSSYSTSSSQPDPSDKNPRLLPKNFSGMIHLLKHEASVAVSPFNDLDITWNIPVSANLQVRTYQHNDYEIAAPKTQSFQTRVPLPLNDDLPRFHAPSKPPIQQPLVPININNFVDIYCSTFPVKAKTVDTADAHPFFQEILQNVDDIIVHRLDEVKRLYVKDAKSDTVYSLSPDCNVSFIEYPEKFKMVSELLHLPVGTEVRVLEDIAADFPKPFSLRLGDVIRLTSNTPYFVKMKHANRDCQVVKCERVVPNGGDNRKLKLPMDLEVSMVMATDSSNRKIFSMEDLLGQTVPIPTQNVASVIDTSDNTALKELPVDLRILKSMKESSIVVSSPFLKIPSTLIPKPSSTSNSAASSKDKKAGLFSSQTPVSSLNVGLPLTSGIVLAFTDKLDLFELDVAQSEADYVRLPLEKLTLAQFEEREHLRKLNSDYEDVSFGSNSALEECGTASGGGITRTNSAGVLDTKQKNTKMDKVLRLSRALNPKHWRQSKAEPEPLPHPSAMGLMALAARPRDDTSNDYHQSRVESSSVHSESSRGDSIASGGCTASSDEEENFYEDVEIGPIKSSTIAAPISRQTGVFFAPTHRSLPPRSNPKLLAKSYDSNSRGASDDTTYTATASGTTKLPSKASGSSETHAYDVPKPYTKAKNWAANIGNNIGDRLSRGEFFNTKPKYDVPKNSKAKDRDDKEVNKTKTNSSSAPFDKPKYDIPKNNKVKDYNREDEEVKNTGTNVFSAPVDRPPDQRPPPPPRKNDNKPRDITEINDIGTTPIAPARRKGRKIISQTSDAGKDQLNKDEEEKQSHDTIPKSSSLNDSAGSFNDGPVIPTPRPRGLKKPTSFGEEVEPAIQSPLPKSRSLGSDKGKDILSVNSLVAMDDQEVSQRASAKDAIRPTPPPKPRMSTHTTV